MWHRATITWRKLGAQCWWTQPCTSHRCPWRSPRTRTPSAKSRWWLRQCQWKKRFARTCDDAVLFKFSRSWQNGKMALTLTAKPATLMENKQNTEWICWVISAHINSIYIYIYVSINSVSVFVYVSGNDTHTHTGPLPLTMWWCNDFLSLLHRGQPPPQWWISFIERSSKHAEIVSHL